MHYSIRILRTLAAVLLLGVSFCQFSNAQEGGSATVEFSDVRPVLRKRCVTCHNIEEARGDLDLSGMAAIEAGSGSGPVIVPGNPNESLLYTVAAHLEEPVMPPNSPKIPGRELDLIKRWIEGMGPAAKSPDVSEGDAEPISERLSNSEMGGLVSVRPLLRPTSVNSLAVHPSKPIFAVAGRGQAVIGSLESGEWIGGFNFPFGEVTSLKFSSDGDVLLVAGGVGGLSGTVLGINVETGERLFQIADELDTILAVDMSNNGRLLAVGGPKKIVRIYSIDSGEVVHTLRKHTDWVMSLAFSPDGLLLASGDRFGGVFVWNPENGELFHGLQGHQGPVAAIAWDNGSETLLTGCEDGKLRVWNMHHGEMTTAWDAKVGPILSLAHSSNNITFVGGRNDQASVWMGPEIQKSTLKATDQVVQVGLDGVGKTGVFGDSLGNICIVTTETGEVVRCLSLPVGDEEVGQLIARLEKMEKEYLANVEVEREKKVTTDIAQAEPRETILEKADMPEVAPLNVDSAEAVIASVEAAHASLMASFKNQQQIVAKLQGLRERAEESLTELSLVQQEAKQLLQAQGKLVEESKIRLESIRMALGGKLGRERLVDRLNAETVLLERTTELMSAMSSEPHLQTSEESQLLETLKQNLTERVEATRQAIEIFEQ